MSFPAKQPAKPAAPAEARPRPDPAIDDTRPVAGAVAAGVAGALRGGGVGLTSPRRSGGVQGYQAVLALQRTHGNAAVLRLLARDVGAGDRGTVGAGLGGRASVAADVVGRGRSIQRHTSVQIEEPENTIKRNVVIQRDLATDLSGAMRIGIAGMQIIYQAIPRASADDRRAVLNNSALLAELKSWLPRSSMVTVLRNLGAPLADQLDTALEGTGAAAADVLATIENPATSVAQKALVLRNPALMARLRGRLNQDAAIRAMRGLGASLTEQLYAAMEDALYGLIPANQDAILKPIAAAPAGEKQAAVRDRALVGLLAGKLSLRNMLKALDGLGASLADRLNLAIDGAFADTDAIEQIAAGATADQRQEILDNTALVARLRGKLTPHEMRGVLARLGASLADQLRVALDAGEADAPWTLVTIETADKAERDLVRENSALVGRMQSAMSAPAFERVGALIGLPLPVAAGAGSSVPMALGGGAAKAGVNGVGGLDLAEPQTLVGKISASLDQTPPDVGAAIVTVTGATPDEQATVRRDSTLRDRLYAALDQAQLLRVMTLLGVGLPSRLSALLDRKAMVADLQTHVAAATPADKRAVLDDRVLVERLVAHAGLAQRTALLGALGDSLGNQLDQVLADAPTLAALWNLIRHTADADRQTVSANSALMGRIAAAITPYDFFQTQVLLLYGSEAAYPGPVTSLVQVSAMPRLWAVKSALGALADADLAKIKTAVREYLRPRLGEGDFATLGRILDQGLITEETIKETDPGRKMLADSALLGPFLFTEREFTGTRGFDVAYYRDRVQVTVRVKFEARDGDAAAEAALPALLPAWETVIESAWDNKFNLRNARRLLPIRVDLVANSGSPHHRVNVGSATNVPWGAFNTFNWYYQAANFNLANSIPHEFGHMLGNPDEYNLSAAVYQARVGRPGATDPDARSATDIAGQQRFTNRRSVMGSPLAGAGPVERRHLNYFTNWLNRNRVSGEPAFTLV